MIISIPRMIKRMSSMMARMLAARAGWGTTSQKVMRAAMPEKTKVSSSMTSCSILRRLRRSSSRWAISQPKRELRSL